MIVKDKKIWLTGASSGIGEAVALELNAKGALLLLSSRNAAELQRVQALCPYPDKVQLLPLDLEQTDTLPAMAEKALKLLHGLDVLINCAGISQRALAKDSQTSVDRRLMEVNYFAPMILSKSLLPYFLKQGRGHFVTVSSVVGKYGTPMRSGYSASKHALHGFYDSLRAENGKDGIIVTLICPGFIRTQLTMNALTGDGSPQRKMDKTTAAGISPADCAKGIVKAIEQEKQEVIIAGLRERSGVYLKRFFPGLFARILPNVTVV